MQGESSDNFLACVVKRVRAADDMQVLVLTSPEDGLYKQVRIRLAGVDTPSTFFADEDSDAVRLREEVRSLVGAADCRIAVEKEGAGNSGWLVRFFWRNGREPYQCLNSMLLARGYHYSRKTRGKNN